MNHELLDERILVLHQIIESTSEFYFNSNLNKGQTGLYDTIIGAALWYLPRGVELFCIFLLKCTPYSCLNCTVILMMISDYKIRQFC